MTAVGTVTSSNPVFSMEAVNLVIPKSSGPIGGYSYTSKLSNPLGCVMTAQGTANSHAGSAGLSFALSGRTFTFGTGTGYPDDLTLSVLIYGGL